MIDYFQYFIIIIYYADCTSLVTITVWNDFFRLGMSETWIRIRMLIEFALINLKII